MPNLILVTASLLVVAGAADAAVARGAAVATAPEKATCDAKYYDYLVGKAADQLVNVQGANYRVLPAGADGGKANPKRITVKVDKSNRIVELACG